MNPADTVSIDHFTIDVSDLDAAQRFYCEGLGFSYLGEEVFGEEVARLAQVDGEFRVRSRYIQGNGLVIVLRRIEIPVQTWPAPRRQLGLANFAVRVAKLEESMAAIEAAGGSLLQESFTTLQLGDGGYGRMLLCKDPDGQLIELIEPPSKSA